MSDLIDDPIPGQNAPEFSVAELSGAIKRVIEGEFAHVRVRGEVGRVSRPKSGHLYLNLKDDRAVISGVIWKGVASRLRTQPEEGMEVVATGKLTTFPGQSRYQIVIEDIAPAGVGALMAMLEKRKAALTAEGLFAAERKRALPYLPEVIGVVTSPSGAVIRDILHRLRDRFPRKVLVWPVVVQGDKCAAEVANAINGFNALETGGAVPRPDVLIVARGGGSIEDLWGFNEEVVVRAAAASKIPLISAVGHETDTTLIDYASDQRAPTPTAAAEIAVPVRAELLATVAGLEERRRRALARLLEQRGQRLRDLARALPRPDAILNERAQRLDALTPRLLTGLERFTQKKRVEMAAGAAGRLRPSILSDRMARRHDRLAETGRGLARGLHQGSTRAREKFILQSSRLRIAPLEKQLHEASIGLKRSAEELSRKIPTRLAEVQTRLLSLNRMLETLSYQATLGRGYAVIRAKDSVVTTKKAAKKHAGFEVEFVDGRLDVGQSTGSAKFNPKLKSKPTSPKDDQGTLF